MAEPVGASEDAEGIEQRGEGDDGRAARTRLFIALLILLLLFACVAASIADVYVTHTPTQIAFVRRNAQCLQCHTELIPDMSKATVHNPFLLKDCETCHVPHGFEVIKRSTLGQTLSWSRFRTALEWIPVRWLLGAYDAATGRTSVQQQAAPAADASATTTAVRKIVGGASYLRQPESQLCWTCHGDLGPLRSASYQHQPFQAGYCTACHDPHASDNKALLRSGEREICKTCHPMGEELSRAQAHPPAAGWYCTNCHDPHASNWRGILVRRQRELCFECHPTVAMLSQKSVQHNPFLYDNCTGCHQPHGADARPLLDAEQPDLCYGCHPAIRKDFQRRSHHPVGVKLDCAACHNPHAADYDKLLTARDNTFCYQCHRTQIAATYQGSKHQDRLCVACHTPHGSDFAPLLRNSQPELCLACHNTRDTGNDYEGANRHPVSPRFYDVHHAKPLTCTSSCHNPHGTMYPMMLNYPSEFDGLCLWCHPNVGRTF